MLVVLMKIISHADAKKKKKKRLKGSTFCTFIRVVFKSHHGSEGVKKKICEREYVNEIGCCVYRSQ